MIEQLIGEWDCGLDRVRFRLVEGELVVRAWRGDEVFILSAATRDGVWAYLVPSNDCRVHQEVMSIGPNEFTTRWFNSDGLEGEITYRRVKPTPISSEGRQGHAYAAGVNAERARLAAVLDDGSDLALHLAAFIADFATTATLALTPIGVEKAITRAFDELMRIIREELEVHDGE